MIQGKNIYVDSGNYYPGAFLHKLQNIINNL